MKEDKISKMEGYFGIKKPLSTSRNREVSDEWYDRYFNLTKSKHNWQTVAFTFLLMTCLLILSLIYFSARSQYIPYIVQVDNTGAVNSVNMLKTEKYNASENEINYFLSQFIVNTRSVPLDEVLFNRKVNESSYFLTDTTSMKLKKLIEKDDVVTKLKDKTTINVNIKSINKLDNATNTYQVRWEEVQFNKGAGIDQVYTMIGIYTIDTVIPKNQEMVAVNPLGLIIKDFSVSREN